MALSLTLASPTSAAVLLDQATIPESGHIARIGSVGGELGPLALGQTFTVGVSGRLDKVSLGMENWYASSSTARFEILDTSNVVLFAVDIAATELPTLGVAGIDAAQAFTVSVRSANILVSAGDMLMLKVSGSPGTPFGQVWRASNADGLISYSGGESYRFDVPGFPGPVLLGNEFAFRTYVDDLTGSAVPEPGAWAMMIVGFGVLGSALRARRRVSATVS
ncbi:PEPxxWA-CTERM sorting domain-containing protein [Phenylobacterium sp. LjRoot164]|uniref:PEPxxWA-CTERM sorting domain-containing protein n=1 Tax=Phenylobacterium sp. LjRoot164 TaxID=3342272 RepID=UPI003ECE7BB5